MKSKPYRSFLPMMIIGVFSALFVFHQTQNVFAALILLLWVGGAAIFLHHLTLLYEKQIDEGLALQRASVSALVDLAQMRDYDNTGSHLHRLSFYAQVLGTDLNLTPELKDNIAKTIALHDIGKVAVPDQILHKPGPLNLEEWSEIQKHPLAGAMVLDSITKDLIVADKKTVRYLHTAKEIALYHHERWDGTGYPHGLKGEEIPLSARIAAVCDVYDSLRSPRPYKQAFTHEEAVAVIRNGEGSHFDPKLVCCFLRLADKFAAIWNEHGTLARNSP